MSIILGRRRDLIGRLRYSVDWVVVTIAFALVTLAVINLNSAGAGDWTGYVQTQLRWILLGAVAMFTVSALDYRVIYRGSYVAYGVGVALLLLVWFIGFGEKADRWLGVGAFRIQPSEIMKVLLIMALARYLHNLGAERKGNIRNLVAPFVMVMVPVGLTVAQPDLGQGVLLLLVAFSVLTVTELRLRGVLVVLSTAVLSFALGWRFMEDYQRTRIDVWLNPELYADNEAYQTIQGMISVGNGGFFGRGVRQGTQNVLHYLPERFTDFPFAVYAEEWGFVGSAMLLTLYLSLILWAINLASQARDRFGALLCAGVAAMFFWHVVINVGMVLQLLPVTGTTLPFVSLGGSNVLTMMIGLGILISVSRSRHQRGR
jgi:rod shape determining protein RodA